MYLVIDDDQAQEQVAALPAEALPAYADIRTLLEVAVERSPLPPGQTQRADAHHRPRQFRNRGVSDLGTAP
jgi:hypothetical protein